MDTQEKMFFTFSEAALYLGIKEDRLPKWINRLQIGARMLPGMNGTFLARRDVLLIQENMKHPDVLL